MGLNALLNMFQPIQMEDEPHVLNEGTDIRRRSDEFPNSDYDQVGRAGDAFQAEQGPVPQVQEAPESNIPWYAAVPNMSGLPANPPAMEEGVPQDSSPYGSGRAIRDGITGAWDGTLGAVTDFTDKWLPTSQDDPIAQYKAEQIGLMAEGQPYDETALTGSADQWLQGLFGKEESPMLRDDPDRMEQIRADGQARIDEERAREEAGEPEPTTTPTVAPIDTEVEPRTDQPMTPDEQTSAVADTADASGNPNPDVAAVVASDSRGWKRMTEWTNDVFGINGQDLAKFGLFYAGSRIAGYRHGESMGFGFEQAMADNRTRATFTQRANETGKYSQDSLDQFKRTGKYEDLVLVATPNPRSIDLTSSYLNADGVRGYVTKDSQGNQYYTDATGRRLQGEFFPSEQPQTRMEMVNEYKPALSAIIDETRSMAGEDEGYGVSPGDLPNWQITATEGGSQGAEILMDEAARLGLDVDSTFMTSVYGNAVRASVQDARNGAVVTNLAPYIKAQLRYYDSTDPWAGALGSQGERMPVEEWYSIQGALTAQFADDPDYQAWVGQVGEGVVVDSFMTKLYDQYNQVEDKSQYISRESAGSTGFKTWLKSELGL